MKNCSAYVVQSVPARFCRILSPSPSQCLFVECKQASNRSNSGTYFFLLLLVDWRYPYSTRLICLIFKQSNLLLSKMSINLSSGSHRILQDIWYVVFETFLRQGHLSLFSRKVKIESISSYMSQCFSASRNGELLFHWIKLYCNKIGQIEFAVWSSRIAVLCHQMLNFHVLIIPKIWGGIVLLFCIPFYSHYM